MLTERDLELIEVALDSAISATEISLSFSQKDDDEMFNLAEEYRTAQAHVAAVGEKYAALLEFVKTVAGSGYISTRATAQKVLREVGE